LLTRKLNFTSQATHLNGINHCVLGLFCLAKSNRRYILALQSHIVYLPSQTFAEPLILLERPSEISDMSTSVELGGDMTEL